MLNIRYDIGTSQYRALKKGLPFHVTNGDEMGVIGTKKLSELR